MHTTYFYLQLYVIFILQPSRPQFIRVPSTLSTIRQELSKLQPPRWTKQQQPKRVFKSEDKPWSDKSFPNINSSSLVRYNSKQIKTLKVSYFNNKNPTSNEFHLIAEDTGLQHYQVKKWFQNRRAKERKSTQKK